MSTRNRTTPRLGRGLSSLISRSTPEPEAPPPGQYQPEPLPARADKPAADAYPPASGDAALEIPIDRIAPNPYQPRRDFDGDQLAELADSIRRQGILQPLLVTHSPGADSESGPAYVLIAGERRLRAARLADLSAVPCLLRDVDPRQMLEWALIENIQRTDLNPIERATAYRDYIDRFSLTHTEGAQRLGQPRATITNYLRLLDLPDSVQEALTAGELTFGHAKVLAGLAGRSETQLALAKRAVAKGLSVRELERLAGEAEGSSDAAPKTQRGMKPAYIRDLEEQLTQAVGTRVVIRPGRGRNTGQIRVDYYNLDDFDRISAALGLKVQN